MKRIALLLSVILLAVCCLVACSACDIVDGNINLRRVFKKNYEFARPYFEQLESFDGGVFIVDDPTQRNPLVPAQEWKAIEEKFFSTVKSIVYAYSETSEFLTPLMVEFETSELAALSVVGIQSRSTKRRNNIVFVNFTPCYLLLDGSYDTISNYAVSKYDNSVLLFDLLPTRTVVDIPEQITMIAGFAFYKTDVSSLICNNNLIEIGAYAFADCTNLTYVKLNHSLVSIEGYAFASTTFKYVVIPISVQYIGEYAFPKNRKYYEGEEKPSSWDKNYTAPGGEFIPQHFWEYGPDGEPKWK